MLAKAKELLYQRSVSWLWFFCFLTIFMTSLVTLSFKDTNPLLVFYVLDHFHLKVRTRPI